LPQKPALAYQQLVTRYPQINTHRAVCSKRNNLHVREGEAGRQGGSRTTIFPCACRSSEIRKQNERRFKEELREPRENNLRI